MGKATKPQLNCINALLNKLGLMEIRADVISGATQGRITSRADLTIEEAKYLIQWLKSKDPEEVSAERQRRYIISMAHECGYRIPGTTKVDMQRLDNWCIKFGAFGKKLNSHTPKELPTLVTQFKAVYKGVIKSI